MDRTSRNQFFDYWEGVLDVRIDEQESGFPKQNIFDENRGK